MSKGKTIIFTSILAITMLIVRNSFALEELPRSGIVMFGRPTAAGTVETNVEATALNVTNVNVTQKPIPKGNLFDDCIFYEYAIYFLPKPKKEPESVLKKLLKHNYKDFRLLSKPDVKSMSVTIREVQSVKKDYAPPDMRALRYFGRGLTKEVAEKLQKTESVFILDFGYPSKYRTKGIIQSSKLMKDITVITGGIIWDDQTRQCFSLEQWVTHRINGFSDDIPDISKHITIHVYKDGEYIRAITLGMQKFGLPDIEVSDFSWSDYKGTGNLINLFGQQLFEVGKVKTEGKFELDISKINHKKVRQSLLDGLYENSKKKATIKIIEGVKDKGDPENRIIEIVFDNYPGKNKQEKIYNMLSELLGWGDSISYIKHNEEILKASERARKKLPEIKKKIKAGLEPGEYYMVKAPFNTPDGGNEWMWVEIISWNGSKIKGLLKNQPSNIPRLKVGAEVIVNQEDVFDYIHQLPDGSSEGNETGRLIEKYSK